MFSDRKRTRCHRKLDTDFRAFDAVFIEGEAADGFSDEFLTNDDSKSSL
jgi:hypothetical protein